MDPGVQLLGLPYISEIGINVIGNLTKAINYSLIQIHCYSREFQRNKWYCKSSYRESRLCLDEAFEDATKTK